MADKRASHVDRALAGIVLGLILVAGVTVIALFNKKGPRLEPDWFSVIPFLALAALPAVLAIIGLRRPAALLAAGILSIPTAFLSFAGVTLPLLIPAGFYLVAYGRARSTRPRLPAPLIALFVVAAGAASFYSTISSERTVCHETLVYPDGRIVEERTTESDAHSVSSNEGPGNAEVVRSSCTTGAPPTSNIATAIALITAAATGAAWMSKPQPKDAAS